MHLQVKSMTVRQLKKKGVTGIYKDACYNVRFEVCEFARRCDLLNTFHGNVTIASVGGALGAFFLYPMAKAYVRMKNDELLPPNKRRYYHGLCNGLYRIYREEGFNTLFAGSPITSLRGMMGTIGQLAFYDQMKICFLEYPQYFGEDFKTYFLTSLITGCLSTLFKQPFEVMALQSLNAGEHLNPLHGIGGFFQGLGPGFLRIVPHVVVTYMILETLRMHFEMSSFMNYH